MIVLDAGILIAHLDETDAHHARATALLVDAAASALAASPITLAEVLVGPTRMGRLADARAALRTLEVSEAPLGADASARLAALRVETDLKLPDCCVLLAAYDVAAQSVLSFDDGLASAARAAGFATP